MLRSVDNALSLLECFTADGGELGVTELSRTLGLGKSTVHRLLTTLCRRGYVVRSPQTDKYRLGLKAFEVGAHAIGVLGLRESAAPVLAELQAATRETVHLGVLDGWEVVYIDKIDSQQTLRMYSRVGRRAPLHCTALGKVLLASMPESKLARFLRRRLKAYTPATIVDPARLAANLATVRRDGCALDNEEFELGLRCAAAPIRDLSGDVVASVGIAGPAVRLSAERLGAMAARVRHAAAAISASLGFKSGMRAHPLPEPGLASRAR